MKKAVSLPWKIGSATNALDTTIDPVRLEREHVKKVYDNIATHWSGTRYKAWPKVEKFILNQPKASLIADIGCGNGKNLFACNEIGFSIGTDISYNLLQVAKQKSASFEVAAMDIMELPFRKNIFDSLICIAVLHHISTLERRVLAIEECIRIIKPKGTALFYAWAKEQEQGIEKGVSGHKFQTNDVLVPWHIRHGIVGDSEIENIKERVEHAVNDDAKNALVLKRYCHVYSEKEWTDLFHKIKGIVINKIYWDTGNWAISVTKI